MTPLRSAPALGSCSTPASATARRCAHIASTLFVALLLWGPSGVAAAAGAPTEADAAAEAQPAPAPAPAAADPSAPALDPRAPPAPRAVEDLARPATAGGAAELDDPFRPAASPSPGAVTWPDPATELGEAGANRAGELGPPLPPPPPGVEPSAILEGPWRGRFWLDLRLDVGFPLAGERPAKMGDLVAAGGGIALGFRLANVVGLWTGLASTPFEVRERFVADFYDRLYLVRDTGILTSLDLLVVRLYAPLPGRVQPFLDAGAGLAVLDQAFADGRLLGGQGLFGVGFEGWVASNVTLGLAAHYRLLGLDGAIGHNLAIAAALGLHW